MARASWLLAAAACGLGAADAALAWPSGYASLHGSGTTNPSKYFWKIMEMFQAQSKSPLELNYRAVGSTTGQKEFSQITENNFAEPLTDFGAGDLPMTQARYDSMTTAGRQMVHVPFSLGAIGIFHSVPAGEVGSAGLKLSPCVLAKIFKGVIKRWDHSEIKRDNPDLSVPADQPIRVGHRTHGSSSTAGFAGYLSASCNSEWGLGSGSTVTWPTASTFSAVQGSPGMLSHITDTPYAIGYMDAGHGHQRHLAEAKLLNMNARWLNSAEAIQRTNAQGENGIAAAGNFATLPTSVTADWSAVNLLNKAGDDTWPIVLVSYMYLPKDISTWTPDKAALLNAFVSYVTGSAGQALLSEFSFNAIPAAMNKWAETWSSVMVKPAGVTNFAFETATDPWAGQQDNVISVKRNSYSLWKLNELQLAMDSAIARLNTLEGALNDYGIVPLHGSGTTNPKNWFAKAMKLMEHRSRVPMLLTYRAVGSSTGQREFVGQASNGWTAYSHFGAGDIPMSGERFRNLTNAGRHMVHLPFAMGAIGIFHSVPQGELGAAELKLDACLLAKIFAGTITTWDHADIKAQNPGLSVPAGTTIKVGHRTLGSSSTGGVTGYLHKKCPDQWTLGAGSSVAWTTGGGFTPVQGSPGMQELITGTQYAIGYLDSGHGHDFGLSEVALTNQDGETRTSKQAIAQDGVAAAGARGVESGVFPMDSAADWSAVNLYDMPGATTWPIVLVSYMYIAKDQTATNKKTAAALKAFIDFILNDRDGLCQEFGFTLPAPVVKEKALRAAGTIVWPSGMESFIFEAADATQKYVGMGDNVISGKRHDYDDYRSKMMEREIAMLRDPNGTSYMTTGHATGAGATDPTPIALSAVALVVSLLAMALSTCIICKGGGGYSKHDAGVPAMTYGSGAQA